MGARIYASEDFLGFDVRKGRRPYQMVPVGSTRLVDVETGHDDCVLRTRDDRIVSIAALERIELWGREHYKYPLCGVAEGRTQVVMEDHRGHVQAELTVSVKERLEIEYSVFLLADSRRQTARLAPSTQVMMGGIGKLLLQQANVLLRPRTFPMLVKVNRDLGAPLAVTAECMRAILTAMPIEEAIAKNTLQIFCTWKLQPTKRGVEVLGFNWEGSPYVFLADGSNVYVLAHEILHALNVVEHNKVRRSLMYESSTQRPEDNSARMFWFEIDTANPSGT